MKRFNGLRLGVLATMALALFRPGPAPAAVTVDRQGENRVLSMKVESIAIRASVLGQPAPEGRLYLDVIGTISNRNTVKGVSVPPVEKAFKLRIDGTEMVSADPISADTPDPFWGPLTLNKGEKRPFEVVFAVPDRLLKSAELRHLSNQGGFGIYLIGNPPRAATHFLAGPVRRGDSEMAVISLRNAPEHAGRRAADGWEYVAVQYQFTNRRALQPLQTNLAGLTALVEDGGYQYQPLSAPARGQKPTVETYYAGEPARGELVFRVPKTRGSLELVLFTEAGALRLNLSPGQPAVNLPAPVAGPSRDGRIAVSIFAVRALSGGLVLDIGLRLNLDKPLAELTIDPAKAFELHDPRGQFKRARRMRGELRRPLGRVALRRDQTVRGEVYFPGTVLQEGMILVLPLASGRVSVPVPYGQRAAGGGAQNQTAQSGASGVQALLGAGRLPGSGDERDNAGTGFQAEPIDELLAKADRLIQQNRLSTPKGNSAVDRLSEVLRLDPANAAALQYFRQILAQYLDWARTAEARGLYSQARRHAEQAIGVADMDAAAFGFPPGQMAALHLLRGRALAAQGQRPAARAAFLRALDYDPRLEAAHDAIAKLDEARPVPRETAAEASPRTSAADVSGPPDTISGIPRVLDTGTLEIRGEIIPLYGIVGEDEPFAAGLRAFIRNREVECQRHDQRSFSCRLEGADLSGVVLLNGAGRTRADAPDELKALEAQAKRDGKGRWK